MVDLPEEPPGEGWQPYIDFWGTRPWTTTPSYLLTHGATLEIWRKEWGNETSFLAEATAHPAMNVAGLYWRVA